MFMDPSDTDIQILRKDIEIDKHDVLGRGGFGHVFAGYLVDHSKVAVKLLIDQGSLPNRNVRELRREAKRLKELSHHGSIIDLCGVLLEPDSYGLVLEYMLFGSSAEFVKSFKVDLPLLIRMTCQVASAMMYLHSYEPPILHLDLKADNILIDQWFNAKVSDFGLSEWKTVTKMVTKGGSPAPRRCTLTHIAPEIFKDVNQKSTEQLDIYAFGITVWEFFSAQRPYENKSEDVIRHAVCDNQRPDLTTLECPIIIRLMISKCWHNDPNERPPFKTIFAQMEKAYEDHKYRIKDSLKSIRRQICQKCAVNDPEYQGTEYIDEMDVTEIESVPMETGAIDLGDLKEGDKLVENMEDDKGPTVLKVSPPLEYSPAPRHLTNDDMQLRRVLQNPLALEMVRSGLDNTVPLSQKMCEVVRDNGRLREYINNDPSLRTELLRSGSPLLSKLNTPRVREGSIQGRNEQYLSQIPGSLDSSNHPHDPTTLANLSPEEKTRQLRIKEMRDSSYASKLYTNGVGEKLLKVLREPYKLRTAIENDQSNCNGVPQKFETLDRPIMNAAQDPFLLQILLSQDQAMLNSLMMNHSDMMMKLISANKNNYKTPSSTYSTRSTATVSGPQRHRQGNPQQRKKDTPVNKSKGHPHQHKKHVVQDFDLGPFQRMRMDNIRGNDAGTSNGRTRSREDQDGASPMETNPLPIHPGHGEGGIDDNIKENKKPEVDKEDKREDNSDKAAENQRKILELIHAQRRINAEKEKNKQRKKEERERVEQLERDHKDKQQETGKDVKMEGVTQGAHGGMLDSLFGWFKGSHDRSLFETPPNRISMAEQPPSMVSVDQFSLENDELTGPGLGMGPPVRSHANPLAPRPEPTPTSQELPRPPSGATKTEPSVKQEPTPQPNDTPSYQVSGAMSLPRQGPCASEMGGASGGAGGASVGGGRDKGGGGATGGEKSKNIIISHKHAGGGFSHITINQDLQNVPNIQVGNRNMMVVGHNSDSSDEPETRTKTSKHKKKKTRHREIKLPDQPLDMDRIDTVCTEIGKDWKKLSRALGLDDAQIEQIHQDYHINGIYEVMYQALHKWLQKNGKAGTARALGQHLSNMGRYDLIKKLNKDP